MIVKTMKISNTMEKKLKYVVICVYSKNKWLLSRHKKRNSWEIPGGHIEPGESVINAAKRELFEETGLKTKNLYPICDYYAEESQNDYAYGRLFFCSTKKNLSPPKEYEMAETKLFSKIPSNLTHKEIHRLLHSKAVDFISTLKN